MSEDRSAMTTQQPPTDAELRALAEAATPGPWYSVGKPWAVEAGLIFAGSEDPHAGNMIGDVADSLHPVEDAAYIAAASPDVVLALLDRLAAAEAEAAGSRTSWDGPVPDCHCQHVTGGRCLFAATEALDRLAAAEGLRTAAQRYLRDHPCQTIVGEHGGTCSSTERLEAALASSREPEEPRPAPLPPPNTSLIGYHEKRR